MERAENQNEITADGIRHQQIDQYWAGDLSRRVYLLRRQRKAILENCRRIAVVGANPEPNSSSFVAFERLLGLGLEIIPVFADRESFLGLRCYKNLRDIPGKIDIVQVYPNGNIDCIDLARAAVDHGVSTFWIEQTAAASREVEDLLVAGHAVRTQRSRGRGSCVDRAPCRRRIRNSFFEYPRWIFDHAYHREPAFARIGTDETVRR